MFFDPFQHLLVSCDLGILDVGICVVANYRETYK